MRHRIFSGSKFEDMAGYSRAVVEGDWIFMSGTVGTLPETGEIPESVEDQMTQIFAIITATLSEAQATLADVVHCRVYITDASYLGSVARILKSHFNEIRPANTTLITGIPAPGAKVELEITARRSVSSSQGNRD